MTRGLEPSAALQRSSQGIQSSCFIRAEVESGILTQQEEFWTFLGSVYRVCNIGPLSAVASFINTYF